MDSTPASTRNRRGISRRRGSVRSRLLLRASVSLAIVVVLWHAVPFRAAFAALLAVDPVKAVVGFLFGVGVVAAGAAQIHAITRWQGLSFTVPRHVEIVLQTGFYALFLPGAISGGVVRWYKLARPDGRPAEAISAIVFNRLTGTIVLVGLGLACWLLAPAVALAAPVGLLLAGCLVGLTAFYATAFRPKLYSWLVSRLPAGLLRRVPDAVRTRIRQTLDAITALDGMPARVKAIVFGWALARHLSGIVAFVAFAASLDTHVGYVDAGWIRALTGLLLLLPISVAGIGVRESATIVLLRPLGVPGPTALALSVVLFAQTVLLGLIGGALEARATFRASDRERRAAAGPQRSEPALANETDTDPPPDVGVGS
ncbi:MAG: lysylphosphatidylglycerol synthase transmembrane domain-containing protein [Gemmatimonadota bacterium]